MSLAKISAENKVITGFTTAVLLAGGLLAFTQLGQLEDPEFTIKTANVVTAYPGATAEEVELEVTDRIELALQELPQIDYLESISRPGMSIISVEIIPKYTADQLPQIWDELRKKVRDVREELPPGAGKPEVGDDCGDVYGFLFAVTGDGFTYSELEDYVDNIKKELSLVAGVSRVELWGQQTRCIYVDIQETQLSQLGISLEEIQDTLQQQNVVVDSGGVDLPTERLRIEQTGEFKSPKDIENLVLRGSTNLKFAGRGGSMSELQVHPSMSSDTVPLSQVTSGVDVEWEDEIIWRRNRRRTINIQEAAGKPTYQAVMDSTVSRLRPVLLAAGTTVLGLAPLLPDVFWVAMAVTIMFGLTLGTVLTMILLPVFYTLFFGLKPE